MKATIAIIVIISALVQVQGQNLQRQMRVLEAAGKASGFSEADMRFITSEMNFWLNMITQRCSAGVRVTGQKGLQCYQTCLQPHVPGFISSLSRCREIHGEVQSLINNSIRKCLRPRQAYCDPKAREDIFVCASSAIAQFSSNRMQSIRNCYRTHRNEGVTFYQRVKPACQQCWMAMA